ncbi:hypothetical protein NQ317_017647 [Molorchus minor]|uniref:NUP160 middle TPR domain-containing protein n=1 Tax=Molorchus minor TaxID=1323400 RepID=A0ABQ9JLE1_9CUCU|nr:hypothetical protein NQ317_017647 [Molorchus minor]
MYVVCNQSGRQAMVFPANIADSTFKFKATNFRRWGKCLQRGDTEARKSFARVKCSDEALAHWHLSMLPYLNHLRHIMKLFISSILFNKRRETTKPKIYSKKLQRVFLLIPFLEQRLLRGIEDNPTKAYINYYLKVIQLFELHKARDCAISVANTALSIVEQGDPLSAPRAPADEKVTMQKMLATLYSIKFKHHLALKHYQLAFDSLNSNPDAERKKTI